MLGNNPFSITASSQTITVTENNHGRTSGDTVRFRNVLGSPGGVAFTTYENSSGFSITVTTTDKYTFTLGATPSITEDSGGPTVSAGDPVTITNFFHDKKNWWLKILFVNYLALNNVHVKPEEVLIVEETAKQKKIREKHKGENK